MGVSTLTGQHPDYQMAITARATQFLSTLWGIPMVIQEWEQNKATHHFTKATKSHRISYSQKMVRHCYDECFVEYPSLQRAIPNCNGKGWYGVYLLVTHEFGHAVQCTIPGGRPNGSCHNLCFVRSVARVRQGWTFKQFCTEFKITCDEPEYVDYQRAITMGVRNIEQAKPVPYVSGKVMVTLADAAKRTGVRYQQLYQMVQKGRFQKYDGYVDLREISAWVQSRTRRAA